MNISDWLKRPPRLGGSFVDRQTTASFRKTAVQLSVITQFFPPDYAPTGQLIEELVKQLDLQGVDVEVFTGQPGYAFQKANADVVERFGRVKIKRSQTSQLFSGRIRGKALNGVVFSIGAGFYLLKAIRDRNVVLLTTAPPFLPILGYLANVLFGVPYVCLLYDLYPDIAVELKVVSQQHWLVRSWQAVNRAVWRRSSGLIVLSPAMKQRIQTHCPEVASKTAVIHSWADPDTIVPMAKADNWFARKHDLVDRFTVLYSGNMGRCHDMDTILDAAIRLRDEPIQFVCIGDGAKRSPLKQEVERLGLTNFLFLPYQDRSVLPYSLTACDLSLVSVKEGMESLVAPSKLYSSLSAGQPVAVICPERSYLRQLIHEANCGASFENGDGEGLANFIRLLKADRQTAEQMGQAGRHYLKTEFTPDAIAQQYYKVLRRAVR
jgi:glycosyltransferase involved in cell wall biosynthesis